MTGSSSGGKICASRFEAERRGGIRLDLHPPYHCQRDSLTSFCGRRRVLNGEFGPTLVQGSKLIRGAPAVSPTDFNVLTGDDARRAAPPFSGAASMAGRTTARSARS